MPTDKRLPIHALSVFSRNIAETDDGPLRIMAHTLPQIMSFCRLIGLQKDQTRRIWDRGDIRGLRSPKKPLILLPGWENTQDAKEIIYYWQDVWHGTVIKISEEQMRGQKPLCRNDTNGDGDCHLCHHKAGCLWPDHQEE